MYPLALLIVLTIPLFGLVLGAVLPVFCYENRIELAIILNALGFFIYILPALLICHFLGYLLAPEGLSTPGKIVAALLTVCLFVLTELMTYQLRKIVKR